MDNNQLKLDIINKMKAQDNPLSKIIKFNDDGISFINFEGKTRTIIGEDGRVMLEELAREILMQTFLKDEKNIYSTENYHTGSHRSDLIAKIEKEISNVVEVKENSNINEAGLINLVDDSFNQIKNFYVKDFTNDCFVSVFIMNTELIANNSDLITRYFNLTPMERKDKFKVFSNYGIYIETRRYNNLNKEFSENSWSNLARHGDFSIKNSHLSIDGMKKVYCEIQNAINLPSSSTNSYGIKNVRNIKDPNIFSEKKDLIISIIETALNAYEVKLSSVITTAGKDKDFLVSEDETIFYTQKYSEDYSHLTLCTLNGAIIDGQNSIDSFRWIIETLEKALKNKDKEDKGLIGFEQTIYSYFNSFNEGQLNKFLDFIKKTDLPINIEQTPDAKTARQRAISKNNTMQVTKSELAISDIQIPIQLLANELLEKADINIDFPKKEIFIPSQKLQERTINVEHLARYVHCFIDYTNAKQHTSGLLFRLSQSLGGETKPKSFELLKDQFIDKVKEDNEDSKAIKNRIENTRTQETQIKSILEQLKPLAGTSEQLKDIIDNKNLELEKCKIEIDRLNDKLKSLTDVAYTVRDRKNLVSLIERIFIIEKNVTKQYEKLKADDAKFNVIKNFISNKEKFSHYIFVMSLHQDLSSELKVAEAKDLFWNLVSNIEHISNTYVVDMTSLRNSTEDSNQCFKKDGTSTTIKEARDEFFKINAKSI